MQRRIGGEHRLWISTEEMKESVGEERKGGEKRRRKKRERMGVEGKDNIM